MIAIASKRPELSDSVDVFGFSTRVHNCLRFGRIATVEELLAKKDNELLDIRAFGVACLYEVIDTLAEHGLRLTHSAEPLPPRPAASAPGRAGLSEENFEAAIVRLDEVYGSVAEHLIGLIETVRDDETLHDRPGGSSTCGEGCAGCLSERIADAVTRAVVGRAR